MDFQELKSQNYIIFSAPQNREIQGLCFASNYFLINIIYARSSECQSSNDIGQDYIILCTDGRKLSFALCDGVSQSFFGDAAARFLGNRVAKWLIEQSRDKINNIEEEFVHYINSIVPEATEYINKIPITNSLPPMVIKVLEKKRLQGSQTAFICGRLDYEPNLENGNIVIFWMGDSQFELWQNDKEIVKAFTLQKNSKYFWSSSFGTKEKIPNSYKGNIQDKTLLRAYSDGLMLIGENLDRQISIKSLWDKVQKTWSNPLSDDISFIQIEILKEPLLSVAYKPLAIENKIELKKSHKKLNLLRKYLINLQNMIKLTYINIMNKKNFIEKEEQKRKNYYEFILTGAELYYLAELYNAPAILGIQDPFLGLVADEKDNEIEKEIEKAKNSLIEKGYISIIDQQVIIDLLVGGMTDALLFPNTFIILNLSTKESSKQIFFYKNDNFIVKLFPLTAQTPAYIAQIKYNIICCQELNEFSTIIQDELKIKESSANINSSIIIEKEILEEVLKIIQDNKFNSIKDYLQEKGIDYNEMKEFCNDLLFHMRNFSLSITKIKESSKSQYYDLAILEGNNYYWKLMPLEINPNKILITAIDSQEIKRWIEIAIE